MNTHLWPRIVGLLPWIAIGCVALAACSSSSTSSVIVRPVTGLPPGLTGVACQNNTGDAARIQGVIDTSAPGATIQISGTCLLTRGITLPGDRTYAGGPTTGTVLEQHGPMSFVLASSAYTNNSTTTGDPLQIRNLTITCDGSGSTDGIIIMDWQTDVQQVDVHGCGGSGIVDTSVAQDGKAITNTSVNSRFDDNFISDSGQYGFEVLDPVNSVTDGFFTDNQVASSGAGGVYLQNSEGWVVSGNHLYGDGGDGIDATRLYATTISDNYIEDFGVTMQSGKWYGITGTAQDRLGSVIEGNKVFNLASEPRGASHIYIAVTTTNNGTGYVSAFGNVIATVAPADIGFYFNGAPNALVVASAANQVSGPGSWRTLGAAITLHPGM